MSSINFFIGMTVLNTAVCLLLPRIVTLNWPQIMKSAIAHNSRQPLEGVVTKKVRVS